MVFLLKKSLYGLKQSLRQWYKRFNPSRSQLVLTEINYDSCVYVNGKGGANQILLLLYVDDMLVIGKNVKETKDLNVKFREEFEMKDMVHARRILGVDILINRNQGHIFLSQSNYLEKVLAKYGMAIARSFLTPLAAPYRLSSCQNI